MDKTGIAVIGGYNAGTGFRIILCTLNGNFECRAISDSVQDDARIGSLLEIKRAKAPIAPLLMLAAATKNRTFLLVSL
jgi:hypothetical protein